ncbi:MAG: EI24 domain-containing protein [Bacteriovoracales bacterium]|nr:EI24 domain-containing protein [Bacteriovoracales bacterium]
MSLTRFSKTFSILLKDRLILCMALVPILIGLSLYILLGKKIYEWLTVSGQEMIKGIIGEGAGANFIYSVLFILATGLLFFIVNWTFVMVVSILSAPFNDTISSLVEKRHSAMSKMDEDQEFSFKKVFKNLWKIVLNECKKVSFIFVLTALALALGFIPMLAPVGFLLSALLLAIQFLDYSWCRHEWTVRECLKDCFRNIFSYTFGGVFFMLLMALPLINLAAMPLAVVYFTLAWVDKNGETVGR